MEHLSDCIKSDKKKVNRQVSMLENSLEAFSDITTMPVTFYSETGRPLWERGIRTKVCRASSEYCLQDTPCTASLMSAMNISLKLGEVYFFTCPSGLISMCYALHLEERLQGYLIAGPMLMGTSKEKAVTSFSKKVKDRYFDYSRLLPVIGNLRLFTPVEINQASILFLNSITAPLEINPYSDTNYQQSQEQNLIGTMLINKKKSGLEVEYPYQSETALLEAIRSGDEAGCFPLFSKYMEDIMVFDGGNLAIIKIRLISLITQLMRGSDAWQSSYDNMLLLEEINSADTISQVIRTGTRILKPLCRVFASLHYSGNSDIIKKAITIINTDYSQNINIHSIADEIHVNSTYLSALFKKEVGISAVRYLQEVRLARSEELLSGSTASISDIALECGFASQSYFTKVFRETHGITPKEFRSRK